jgi:hypothetical protein
MNAAERNLLWFLGGCASAAALSWIAFQIQQEQIAPAVLFPLAAGAALGGMLLALRRYTCGPRRLVAIGTAIAWGLLLVIAQDYIGHRVRLGQFDAEIAGGHPLAAAMVGEREMRPSFAEHLAARYRGQPVWWTLDLVLTAAAAGTVVALGTRRAVPSGDEASAGDQPPKANTV